MAKDTNDIPEDVLADPSHVVDVNGNRMTVEQLANAYADLVIYAGKLEDQIDSFGLQKVAKTPEPFRKPVPQPHGSLNPTDGASGKTTPVEPAA